MPAYTNRRPTRRLRRGFSLIEVIVAVTIIAIFAGIIAPQVLIGGLANENVPPARGAL